MHERCKPTNKRVARHYAERGITVCERWSDVRVFIEDIEAEIGPRPPGMTLDRIDNNGGYGPGKVRWATQREQNLNSRRSLRLREGRLSSQIS